MYEGEPPDGKVSCVVDMNVQDFMTVYRGASAAEVGKMILSGRIYVRRLKYRELQACRDCAPCCCA